MDIETQKRYAGAMAKLIKEVNYKLSNDIAQYAYDEDIRESEAEECFIEAFINSGESIGAVTSDSGVDLRDFFRWVISEVFYQESCSDEYKEFSRC